MSSAISLNYRTIIKILGVIILIVGVSMLPALLCAYLYDDMGDFRALLISIVITIGIGSMVCLFSKPTRAKFRVREGYIVVALCWVVASAFGSLPYLLSGFTETVIDGLFESVAGFTTTGCTVVDLSNIPKSLLMWKAITHWLGGMGILVFVISILPALGVNGQIVVRAESPGPVMEKMAVRMSDSAKILYLMYFSFTVAEFILLNLSSTMTPFDALVNTLGSISTGGLFAHPEGLAFYDSLYVELVISIFTMLASVNFILYHYAINRKWSYIFGDVELRAFCIIILSSVAACTAGLYFLGNYATLGKALRDAFFQVVSVVTTSGYVTTDYTLWPTVCVTILFCLLFVGGCAASTSGSIKIVRVLVFFKLIWRGFYKRIHPRSVVAVKLGGEAVPAPVVSSISVFIFMYIGLFLFSCLVLSWQNLDIETTVGTAAGLLSNTGIALGEIGSSGNYEIYADPLKLYLCMLMIMGRLELVTIIILFTRNFWGKDR